MKRLFPRNHAPPCTTTSTCMRYRARGEDLVVQNNRNTPGILYDMNDQYPNTHRQHKQITILALARLFVASHCVQSAPTGRLCGSALVSAKFAVKGVEVPSGDECTGGCTLAGWYRVVCVCMHVSVCLCLRARACYQGGCPD